MPNAQIVADRFHVMKQINQALDQERKKENFRLKESLKPAKKAQKTKIQQSDLSCKFYAIFIRVHYNDGITQ